VGGGCTDYELRRTRTGQPLREGEELQKKVLFQPLVDADKVVLKDANVGSGPSEGDQSEEPVDSDDVLDTVDQGLEVSGVVACIVVIFDPGILTLD